MNLFRLLDQSATRFPDNAAICRGGDVVHSYAELRSIALRLSGALSARCPPGGRVLVATKNCPEFVPILFAIWAAGLVATPVNAKLHPAEIAAIAGDAEPAIIFASASLGASLEPLLGGEVPIVVIGSQTYESMVSEAPAEPAHTSPDDLAWLFYTSGTTGRSKGAMLTHRNLVAMTVAHLADFENISPDDAIIHAAPMSHGSGLYILPYVARGARQVVPASGGFDAAEFLALCERHKGCGAFLAPTMVQRLRLAVEDTGQAPTHLRSIIYGGGPMYLTELRKCLSTFGQIFCELYGQGEAPMTITGLRKRDFDDRSDAMLSSVGWPRSGVEVRITRADGSPAPKGEVGEIECRGDVVMQGYWRNETASGDALVAGWLRTGDVGVIDELGRLTLRDRSKEVIISGGTNIYPREVEETLLRHPSIREIAVLGIPDDEWGETVAAVIVLAPGAIADAAELDRLCLKHIARFKRPKNYAFINDLPKSNYGKVLKREIRRKIADGEIDVLPPAT